MSVFIGHASISEKGSVNGAKGDSTKREVCIRTWYNKPWDFMAVHPDGVVREKHAVAVEKACENDNIGYGQGDRNTLNTLAKAVGYDLSKVGKCNCDCSSLMNVAAMASGAAGVTYGTNGWTTANMKSKLKAAGYKIITDAACLANAEYCVRGAIYVKAGSHTVCGLTNGSKALKTLEKAGIAKAQQQTGTASSASKGKKVDHAKSLDKSLKGRYKVTASSLYLRTKAGVKKEETVITTIPNAAEVYCYGYYTEVNGTKWLLVAYKGWTGFASIKYLEK